MVTTTVKDLRAQLDKLENDFKSMEQQFGPFENTTIMIDVYEKINDSNLFSYKGVGHTKLDIDYTLGIIIIPSMDKP